MTRPYATTPFAVMLILGGLLIGRARPAASAQNPISSPNTTVQTADGEFSLNVNWGTDPGDPDGTDVLEAKIFFLPDGQKFPKCRQLRMIQAAQMMDGSEQYVWSAAQANRNQMETVAAPAAGIEAGFYIDHDASKCVPKKPCSPYFRDSWPNSDASQDGFVLDSSKVQAASLADYPPITGDWTQIRLETCVACQDDGSLHECVQWGGYWPLIEPANEDLREIFKSTRAHPPSSTFKAALKLFEKFYSTK